MYECTLDTEEDGMDSDPPMCVLSDSEASRCSFSHIGIDVAFFITMDVVLILDIVGFCRFSL